MKLKFSLLSLGVALAWCPAAAADEFFTGFSNTEVQLPLDAAVQTLSDGRFVTMDGQSCDLWGADGTFLMNLATFPIAGTTGAFRLHPTEDWVLVGESDSGLIFRIELDGSGITQLAELKRNKSADWETNQLALVSAATGFGGSGFELWRLNISNGNTEVLAALDGAPGPVGVDSTGSAFCATVAGVTPAPAGSSDLFRFQPGDLVADPDPPYGFDDDNVLVLQIESVPPAGAWVEETSVPGFTGDSYYRWNGPNFFDTPGNGTMSWTFEVDIDGTYQLRIYNHHDDPDSTMENDCWVRMDGGEWFKAFSGGGFVAVWNWATSFDLETGSVPASWDLAPGEHTLEVSGRSNDFRIDRMHLYLDGNSSNTLQLAKPQAFFDIQGEEVAQQLLEDLDGVSSVAVDRKQDTIFIAESNASTGVNRVHLFGKAYPTQPLMVDAGNEAVIDNIQYVAGGDPGIYYPFQPGDVGKLYYNRHDLQTRESERFVIEAQRPTLTLTGPGTTGIGQVTMEMEDAWPHGWCYFLIDTAANLAPAEQLVFLNDIPVLHTSMGLGTLIFVNVPIPVDGNGGFSLTFDNPTGATNVFAFQLLVANPSLIPLGSTNVAVL